MTSTAKSIGAPPGVGPPCCVDVKGHPWPSVPHFWTSTIKPWEIDILRGIGSFSVVHQGARMP